MTHVHPPAQLPNCKPVIEGSLVQPCRRDGIEADFLEFNAGARATIAVAGRQGLLVV